MFNGNLLVGLRNTPDEKLRIAREGLDAIKKNIELEKREGRQKRSWRRRTWAYERVFRQTIDSNGRKGDEFSLGFLKSIVIFRGFIDAS